MLCPKKLDPPQKSKKSAFLPRKMHRGLAHVELIPHFSQRRYVGPVILSNFDREINCSWMLSPSWTFALLVFQGLM